MFRMVHWEEVISKFLSIFMETIKLVCGYGWDNEKPKNLLFPYKMLCTTATLSQTISNVYVFVSAILSLKNVKKNSKKHLWWRPFFQNTSNLRNIFSAIYYTGIKTALNHQQPMF